MLLQSWHRLLPEVYFVSIHAKSKCLLPYIFNSSYAGYRFKVKDLEWRLRISRDSHCPDIYQSGVSRKLATRGKNRIEDFALKYALREQSWCAVVVEKYIAVFDLSKEELTSYILLQSLFSLSWSPSLSFWGFCPRKETSSPGCRVRYLPKPGAFFS